MLRLLADENAVGQVEAVLAVCRGPALRDDWLSLDVELLTFDQLGFALGAAVPDDALWLACQALGVILITANRNAAGPSSLGPTIAARNTADALPVLTLADARRIETDGVYRESVATRLLDILYDADLYRGTGRLWLP